MPCICMFYGIIISMQYNDHLPPHFHAHYGEYSASFYLNGKLHKGYLPTRQKLQVQVWADIHKVELRTLWNNIKENRGVFTISPLQ